MWRDFSRMTLPAALFLPLSLPIINAYDPDQLEAAWAQFDQLKAEPEWQIKGCVAVTLRAFLAEAVSEATARLDLLLKKELGWAAERLAVIAHRDNSDRLDDALRLFNYSRTLPPVVSAVVGRLTPRLPPDINTLMWRMQYSDLKGCLGRLDEWRRSCRTEASRVTAIRALSWLTGDAGICAKLDDPHWRGARFPYALFEEEWLKDLIRSKSLNAPTLRILFSHPTDAVALAAAELAPIDEDTLPTARLRPVLMRGFLRKFRSSDFLNYLETGDITEHLECVEQELLVRFPESANLANQWPEWVRSLTRHSYELGRRADGIVANAKPPVSFRRWLLPLATKERLLEFVAKPDDTGIAPWAEHELVRRFPESANRTPIDRWIIWLGPEAGSEAKPIDLNYYVSLVCDVDQALPLRQRALSRIPIGCLPLLLGSMDEVELYRVLDGFDFRSVSQDWMFDFANACTLQQPAIRAFESIADSRLVRAGLDLDRPDWLMEAAARRLGVRPPCTPRGLSTVDQQSFWIPYLLAHAGSGIRRSECTQFPELIANAEELAALKRNTRFFYRFVGEASGNEEEKYVAGKESSPVGGELTVRLSRPRHFAVRSGWRIDYGCSPCIGHHGETRGYVISQMFTRRERFRVAVRDLRNDDFQSLWYTGFFSSWKEAPPRTVPARFDLEAIDLPNTEAALVELASILRLPKYSNVNPTAWPEPPDNAPSKPEVFIGDEWSGLIFYENRRHRGEGAGNWGHFQVARFQVELVVVWRPFPILGVRELMLNQSDIQEEW